MSVPGHALRCGPETFVYKPCGGDGSSRGGTRDLHPVIEAVVISIARYSRCNCWINRYAAFLTAVEQTTYAEMALHAPISHSLRGPGAGGSRDQTPRGRLTQHDESKDCAAVLQVLQ